MASFGIITCLVLYYSLLAYGIGLIIGILSSLSFGLKFEKSVSLKLLDVLIKTPTSKKSELEKLSDLQRASEVKSNFLSYKEQTEITSKMSEARKAIEERRFESAEETLDTIDMDKIDNVSLFEDLAEAYFLLKRSNKAISILKMALDKGSKYANIYQTLAIAYMDIGDLKKAEENFNLVLDLDEKNVNILILSGYLKWLKDDLDGEISITKKTLKYAPYDMNARNNIAYFYAERGNKNELEESLNLCISLLKDYPKNTSILDTYAFVLFKLGFLEKAKVALNKCLEENSDYSSAYYHLGLISKKELKIDQSKEYFRKVLKLEGKDSKFYREAKKQLDLLLENNRETNKK